MLINYKCLTKWNAQVADGKRKDKWDGNGREKDLKKKNEKEKCIEWGLNKNER